MRSARFFAVLGLLTFVGAANASATVTQTSISAPANHSYLVWHSAADTQVTVAGSAPGAANGDQVDIYCYDEDSSGAVQSHKLIAGVTVENQAFTATTSLGPLATTTCTLRAVPGGSTPTDLTPFTGPAVAVSQLDDANYPGKPNAYQVVGGPNAGKLFDYYIYGAQFSGAMDYLSLSSCGPCDSYAIDPATLRIPQQMFNSDDALFQGPPSSTDVADRSYIEVDGANAYSSYAAKQLYARSSPTTYDGSEDAAHFPTLTLTETFDPATGNVTIHEIDELVRCATPPATPDPAPDGATHANCPDFASTGVRLSRTMVQDQGGRLVTVSDTFSSTDGAAHKLDLLYYQSLNAPSIPSFDFPWWDHGLQTWSTGDVVSAAPVGSPTQINVAQDPSKVDGDESVSKGAITLSAPPQGGFFENTVSFDLFYHPTVPASGAWTITQAFSTAFTNADVSSLSSAAASAMAPAVSINAPANGAKVSGSPLAVSGAVTAGGNGLPSSVLVNGVTVPVGAGGSFATNVPLAPGANTITASLTDTGGLTASASRFVTYTPPPPSSSARITRVSHNGSDLLVGVACSSATCTGNAGATGTLTVTTGRKHHRHRHTIQITVAQGRFTVAAGATQTIKLKLTGAARRYARSHVRVRGTVTLTLTEPNRGRSSLTAGLTLP